MRSSIAVAALLGCAALVHVAGCGVAFLSSSDDPNAHDGGVSLIDGASLADGGSVPPPSDGAATNDTGPVVETCALPGATRACTIGKQTNAVQTCDPSDKGANVWGICTPTDCAGATPIPAGGATSCIPAGTFDMGGIATGTPEADTMPAHTVKMQHRFFMDQYEVSVAEFASWWGSGATAHPALDSLIYVSGGGDIRRWTAADDANVTAPGTGLNCNVGANKPLVSINCVTQATALAYCMARKGRLPTEAEWEYAASGQGQSNLYPWAGPAPTAIEEESCLRTVDTVCVNGSNGHNFPFARPAATKGNTPVAMGDLNNLAGNEAEWTLDFAPLGGAQCANGACWPSGASDPWASKDNNTGAVMRGGSYLSVADQVRTKARGFAPVAGPTIPAAVGFRCVYTD